jgi:hypothetical protein
MAKSPPVLSPDEAVSLFYNGHRIARIVDPPDEWISMGRLNGGEPVIMTPVHRDFEQVLRRGQYYLAEGVHHWEPPGEAKTATICASAPRRSRPPKEERKHG